MVSGTDGDILSGSAGNVSCVQKRRGKSGIVPPDLGLVGSVLEHLEYALNIHLRPVIVVPTGIKHPAIRCDRGIGGVYLIVAHPADRTSVTVHDIQVGHRRDPAVYGLGVSGGRKNNVSVRQILRLNVRSAVSEGQLGHRVGSVGQIHFVNVEIVRGVFL